MPVTQHGTEITYVSDTDDVGLGALFEFDPNDGFGPRIYRWVQMTGSAAARGSVLCRAAAATAGGRWICTLGDADAAHAGNAFNCAGVAQHAIPENYYGWVLKQGRGVVQTDGGVVADDIIEIDTTAGRTDTFASGNENLVIGVALAADDASNPSIAVAYINTQN